MKVNDKTFFQMLKDGKIKDGTRLKTGWCDRNMIVYREVVFWADKDFKLKNFDRNWDEKSEWGERLCNSPVVSSFHLLRTGEFEIIEELILDKAERRYLKRVIKPIINSVRYITKNQFNNNEQLVIHCWNFPLSNGEKKIICGGETTKLAFPSFKEGTMYKGMELHKEYTLEELGIDYLSSKERDE